MSLFLSLNFGQVVVDTNLFLKQARQARKQIIEEGHTALEGQLENLEAFFFYSGVKQMLLFI